MCSEDLDRIQDQINSMEDENYYDHIAPVTQITERQDEFEDEQDFHPDIKENYDLSGDLDMPSTSSNTEQLLLHGEQNDVYREMVQKTNSYRIDSVVGGNSPELRDKILSKILNNLRKTEQIGSILRLCVGERTDRSSSKYACS